MLATSPRMNESPRSTDTGRRVYADLLKARDQGRKRVYVLASHQHFYMENVYDSQYLRGHGGVLPGWVVGTAGAQRYQLPTPSPPVALTNVYGSLLARVSPNGEIVLIDECLTPDSSRFWPTDSYRPGASPPSFDKQFVRDWLETQPWDKTPPPPRLPESVLAGTASRYVEAYERITGKKFGAA